MLPSLKPLKGVGSEEAMPVLHRKWPYLVAASPFGPQAVRWGKDMVRKWNLYLGTYVVACKSGWRKHEETHFLICDLDRLGSAFAQLREVGCYRVGVQRACRNA